MKQSALFADAPIEPRAKSRGGRGASGGAGKGKGKSNRSTKPADVDDGPPPLLQRGSSPVRQDTSRNAQPQVRQIRLTRTVPTFSGDWPAGRVLTARIHPSGYVSARTPGGHGIDGLTRDSFEILPDEIDIEDLNPSDSSDALAGLELDDFIEL